jgi:LacI family gluconate utilization system Gnt-I transcriptional repressor
MKKAPSELLPRTDTEAPAKRRGSRTTGAVTLHDVARLAGVAPITASRALNYPQAVSEKVMEKVRKAVQQTGYVPNLLAGALASKKSRLVAALVPSLSGPVFLETIEALTQSLSNAGYQLMLGQSGYEHSREDALLDAIIGRRPDGIMLTGITRSAQARQRLLASGIPVVEVWDLTPSPIDMLVGFSHEKIGAAVAQYLYDSGRRRVATISGTDERSRRRAASFAEASLRLGMAPAGATAIPVSLVPAPTTLGSGRTGLRTLLKETPDIDAVFCSSDLLALGVMIEAQVQGLAIPDQLAVVGLGDLEFSRDLQPPLTTVRIDGTAIGRTAAGLLIDRAEGRSVAEPICDLGFTIISRATG